MPFTDAAIKRLQPRAIPYREYEGGEIPGFHLQITPTGTRTFYLQHTAHGKRRFYRLGQYPLLGLSAARSLAREYLAILETGADPRDKAAPLVSGTLNDLLDAWLAEQRERGRRRLDDVERAIRGNCAALLERPASSITANDLRAALAAIHARGSRVMANRVRTHLHALWIFGMRHDHDPRYLSRPVRFGIESNPVVAIPRDSDADRVGERVIQVPEIIAVWNNEEISWLARQGIRLLFSTCGQRVNEVIQSKWSEFNFSEACWTIPGERTKNKRDHSVPLNTLSLNLLRELQDVTGNSKWLFPGRNVYWAVKPWGSTALNHVIARWFAGKSAPRWTGQDIRRTVKTEMGKAGISKSTRDLLQNHAMSADVSSKHYDRYDYWPEKQRAAEVWGNYLQNKILQPDSNIIPFKERA